MISGLVAAVAVLTVSAVPALACGGGLFGGSCSPCGQTYSPCEQQVYVAPQPVYVPAPVYSGCNSCGGWVHERLPDPVQQYYYVNQGPTYSGPGNYAPYPTYREGGVSGWDRHNSYYYGHRVRPHFHSWHGGYTGYRHQEHHSLRYGYARRNDGPHFYAPRHSMRYGAPMGMSHRYGNREHMMRRYN
jgi:hypothetical protein